MFIHEEKIWNRSNIIRIELNECVIIYKINYGIINRYESELNVYQLVIIYENNNVVIKNIRFIDSKKVALIKKFRFKLSFL